MKKRNPKDHARTLGLALHAAGVALLALVVCGYFLLFRSRLEDQAKLDAQRIDQLEAFLKDSGEVRTQHDLLQEKAAALQTVGDKFRDRLTQPLDRDFLSQHVRSLARQRGLSVSQLSLGKAHMANNYQRTELRVQCDGSYASICAFLAGVSELEWVVDVAQLRIDAGNNGHQHRMLARLTVYHDQKVHESDKT